MKAILVALLTLTATFSFGQSLKFKITGHKDTTVYLVKYVGTKLLYADTAELKAGNVEFKGSKQKSGMFALYFPTEKQQMMDFVYNNEDVQIEADLSNLMESMKVKKSEENKVFVEYAQYISAKKKVVNKLQTEMSVLEKGKAAYNAKEAEVNKINDEITKYIENVIAQHPNKLASKMIKMTIDVKIPEEPKNENGEVIDPDFKRKFYIKHYWDNIDLNDDGLANTPVFGNKVDFFFGNKLLIQHWDTILYHAYDVIDRLNPKSRAFEYIVSHVASTYGKSQQMGMDKVYTMMVNKYYCTPNEKGESPAFWMTKDKLEELCEKIDVQKNLVMGAVAPNIILPDTLSREWDKLNWVNMHKINAEYTVLYFWESECGHCKKITPKMAKLYDEKLKARNVEVYAIGKATGDSYQKWKDYIVKNKLNFINVGVTEAVLKVAKDDARKLIPRFTTLESLNTHLTYDIFSTPQIYVLDKDKKIIAKRLTISQLEDMLDFLQGKKDAPKLFPQETDDDTEH